MIPIPEFMVFSIELMTPLIPERTELLIALAIFVPILEKVVLIRFHSPLKNEPQFEKTFLIAFHAEEKVLENHDLTELKTFLIPDQTLEK